MRRLSQVTKSWSSSCDPAKLRGDEQPGTLVDKQTGGALEPQRNVPGPPLWFCTYFVIVHNHGVGCGALHLVRGAGADACV